MSRRPREWKPCKSCGATNVRREVVPNGDKEWVIVTCSFCDNRRGAYYRRRQEKS